MHKVGCAGVWLIVVFCVWQVIWAAGVAYIAGEAFNPSTCPYIDATPSSGWGPKFQGEPQILADGSTFPYQDYITINDTVTESVQFSTPDGVTLAGYFVRGDPGMPALIFIHGKGQCLGKYEVTLPMNQMYAEGYSVLGFDMRNHGHSGSSKSGLLTYGSEEHIDVLAGWQWLQDEKGFAGDKIGLVGNSMGGAAVTSAIGAEAGVKAAWVDSPACHPYEVLEWSIQQFQGGVIAPLAPPLCTDAFKDLNSKTEVDVLTNLPVDYAGRLRADQAYYVVGTDADRVVPIQFSEQCYEAALSSDAGYVDSWFPDLKNDKDTWEKKEDIGYLNNNAHIVLELYYTEEYFSRMRSFFNQTLGPV